MKCQGTSVLLGMPAGPKATEPGEKTSHFFLRKDGNWMKNQRIWMDFVFFPKSISDALGSRLVYLTGRGARQKSRTSKGGRKEGREQGRKMEGRREERKEGRN